MRRIIVATACGLLAHVALGAGGYRIEPVASGLDHPWSLAFLPGDVQLVTERPGRLRLIEQGVLREAPVSGLPAVFASGQAGLFDVVPDPAFDANGWIYLSYAHGEPGANALRVARARYADGGLHDLVPIFTVQPPKRGDVHYGGRMAFLADATLVVTIGDGFVHREQAQRLDNHLGKLVRLARDGSAPPDNPYVGRADSLPEIYSLGHRNPQGLVFDPDSAVLYQHEHGPRGGDEVNRIVAGGNYGWPLATHGLDYTGARISPWDAYPGTEPPLLHWTPSIAPAGMALYRGDAFPQWRGDLLVTALVDRAVRRVRLGADGPAQQERLFAELDERLRDVRVAPDGTVWLLTDADPGQVLRVVPVSASP